MMVFQKPKASGDQLYLQDPWAGPLAALRWSAQREWPFARTAANRQHVGVEGTQGSSVDCGAARRVPIAPGQSSFCDGVNAPRLLWTLFAGPIGTTVRVYAWHACGGRGASPFSLKQDYRSIEICLGWKLRDDVRTTVGRPVGDRVFDFSLRQSTKGFT